MGDANDFEPATNADRRRARRIDVWLPGSMSCGGHDQAVTVVDMSDTGARIQAATLPRIGEELRLAVAGWTGRVKVRWAANGEAGLAIL